MPAWLVGFILLGIGLLLRYLFPQKVEGTRADNLKVTTSKYGEHIARVYGQMRVGGANIWLKNNKLKEVVVTRTEGNFFTGRVEITEYYYYATFATAFAWDGPYDFVSQIYFDGELVWDRTARVFKRISEQGGDISLGGGNSAQSVNSTYRIRPTIYLGTQDQSPDSRIGRNTSGYPGICYVIFQDLDVVDPNRSENIGLRLPVVEATVVRHFVPFNPGNEVTSPNRLDFLTNLFMAADADATHLNERLGLVAFVSRGFLNVWSTGDTSLQYSIPLPQGYRWLVMDDYGYIIVVSVNNLASGASSATHNARIYHAETGVLKQTIQLPLSGFLGVIYSSSVRIVAGSNPREERSVICITYERYLHSGLRFCFLLGRYLEEEHEVEEGEERDFEYTVGLSFFEHGDSPSGGQVSTFAWYEEDQILSLFFTVPSSTKLGVMGVTLNENVINLGGVTEYEMFDVVGTPTAQLLGTSVARGLAYSETNNTLILRNRFGLYQLDASDPTDVINSRNLPSSAEHRKWNVGQDGNFVLIYPTGILPVGNGTANVHLINVFNFQDQIKTSVSNFEGIDSDSAVRIAPIYDGAVGGFLLTSHTAVTGVPPGFWYLRHDDDTVYDVAQIIARESQLADAPYDVDLVDETVVGFAVRDGGSGSSPRAVIEDLQRVKGFDFAQVNGTLTYFMRTSEPSITIDYDHTGAVQNDRFHSGRIEEKEHDPAELPYAVTVNYRAFDAHYRDGAQTETVPGGLDESAQTLEFNTNAALTDDEAAQAADIVLQETRDSSKEYETAVLPYYWNLHPGSVVRLEFDDNSRSVVAVVTEMEHDAAIELKLQRRLFDYHSEAVGDTVNDDIIQHFPYPTSIFVPMDIPILNDHDDNQRWYMGVQLSGAGVPSTTTVYAENTGTFMPYAGFTEFLPAGITLVVPDDHHSAWARDKESSLVIQKSYPLGWPDDEEISTTDQLEYKHLLILWNPTHEEYEVISPGKIENLADNRIRFTNLLRGCFGTEHLLDGHETNSKAVYLGTDHDSLRRANTLELEKRRFAAQTDGASKERRTITYFENERRGIRPRAPRWIRGERDASQDLDITWVRRTRLRHGWLDGDAPLGETVESYDVVIRDASTEDQLREVTALVNPEYTYTLSNYQSDSGDGGATEIPEVEVTVYQNSGILGRGLAGVNTV